MEKLKKRFGKIKVKENTKTLMVQDVFSDVYAKYDLMNDIMSFGAHRLWKKRLVEIMNIQKNDFIIDVGAGTSDIGYLIKKNNFYANIISIDLNFNMLNHGKKKQDESKNFFWVNCNAENLPFKDNSFDKYVISFCLRNITYVDKALKEAKRVIKPGGSFYCLEFSSPNTSLLKKIYNLYKSELIPRIGKIVTNNFDAYEYLSDSINNFPQQKIFYSKLNEIGFKKIKVINFFNGIAAIHKGYKII